ncbi:MAG: hypothetical protein CL943_01275 [Candidatus Diapherotrites archaeon]|uniref:Radical SAM core domain-containing protein n=1 Tax=Candidatus Iainarchaeum sp. TaxID=3101447 RepID=A0A2D6M0H0_9ARCH|nr:hypothetical protein [Candidatus Diapherotrites archaeon]|tara:strand:- start:863 stop:2158 length:1296 start_codon:yes stop_codon:yes gene_type:complete
MQLVSLEQLAKRGIEKRVFGHGFVYRYPESKDLPELNSEELADSIEHNPPEKLALYFHTPFCSKACAFCHYYKEMLSSAGILDKYAVALKRELAAYSKIIGEDAKIQSVFFGGGTPTLLKAEALAEVLTAVKEFFSLDEKTEVSIESSPETLNEEKLFSLREHGFNRLSVGIQDFDEKVLKIGNRAHNPEQAEKAIGLAREAGFENINADFIYGLPKQDIESWGKTIERTLELGLDSITASDLRVMKGTAFFSADRKLFPSVETMRKMYYLFVEKLSGKGYLQQFPYQFVRKGKEMRFLDNQWSNGEFVGIGVSSCSFVSSWDYNNAMPTHEYFHSIDENEIGAATGKALSKEELMVRFVALGLKKSGLNRTENGVSLRDFREQFGVEIVKVFGPILSELKQGGLVEEKNGFLGLGYNGLFFHDEIARKLF